MKYLETIAVLTVFFAAIAWFTSIASTPFGEPDREGATVAAVRHILADFVGEDIITKGNEKLSDLVMCLETDAPLDIGLMARKLSDTVIRPVPIAACTSRTVEGNFGMFTAMTYYFGADGQEAGHMKVVKISCESTSICVIDIDQRGSGRSYRVIRSGRAWKIVYSNLRWIV